MGNISIQKITNTLASVFLLSLTTFSSPSAAQIVFVDQGSKWTESTRASYYTQDQGSRIMPLSWMRALKQKSGESFLAGSLSRYGYLPNPNNGETDIPVGFTIANNKAGQSSIGMTCSACHTRQIDVNGTAYRIDGGPAIVDFQNFLLDLDKATEAVLGSEPEFTQFAKKVLGGNTTSTKIAELRLALEGWYLRYHTLIERSLPDPAWGPSRLDAVSMIFNRLTGLDIGDNPSHLIPDNIQPANAPVRYPFLWNAARQDKTQWPGFALNGNEILALARNLGEVYGVFANFHPVKQSGLFELNRDYISNNSANFPGLKAQEDEIWKIGPPVWPWQLDTKLAAQGKLIYQRSTDKGGCTDCHGIKNGAFRSPFHRTWATPIIDVGTDATECRILKRKVDTGIMEGAKLPLIGDPLGKTEPAFKVLAYTVVGGIVQNAMQFLSDDILESDAKFRAQGLPDFDYLKEAFRSLDSLPTNQQPIPSLTTGKSGCAYESRVLRGIWAAAPYLHNGSVASLADLLKPAKERTQSFKLGSDYDIKLVGLAKQQSKFDYVLNTTDCSDLLSGNSRCGHEFGTTLPDNEKLALLEYLKSL